MLGGVIGEPVLTTKAVFDARLLGAMVGFWRRKFARAGTREPVRTFPSVFGAEARTLRGQPIMQRTPTNIATGFEFAIRPRHLIMQPERLGHAFAQEHAVV